LGVEPKEVALAELAQMAGKAYLAPFLVARLGG
jgi:hypothetical protein